jgi:L-lactate dehydrogenase complex protein LldG
MDEEPTTTVIERYLDALEVPGFPDEGEPILPYFRKQLEAMGGRSFEVADAAAARAKVAELFPAAKVVCSAVPEVPGTRRVQEVRDPHALNDVDVGVVRSPLGVAEAGAVWLTQAELVVNALGMLSQHLVVLLDPAAIVDTMHDAYGRLDLAASPYGLFMAGPHPRPGRPGRQRYGHPHRQIATLHGLRRRAAARPAADVPRRRHQ